MGFDSPDPELNLSRILFFFYEFVHFYKSKLGFSKFFNYLNFWVLLVRSKMDLVLKVKFRFDDIFRFSIFLQIGSVFTIFFFTFFYFSSFSIFLIKLTLDGAQKKLKNSDKSRKNSLNKISEKN